MDVKLERPNNPKRDVVIVGGGISGLYCAKKLMEKAQSKDGIKSITILEKTDRWGGRLDTDIIRSDASQIKEEEGAMRFTYSSDPSTSPSNMPLLSSLIKDLEMEDKIAPFYMAPQRKPSTYDPVGVPNCNARYFNGNHFTDWYATQNPNLWKKMFNLEGDEEFKSSDEIVKDIYRKLLDHNKSKLMTKYPDKAESILAQNDIERLQEYENTEYWAFLRNEFTWRVGMQEIHLHTFSMLTLMISMGYSHGCCMMMAQTQGFLFVALSEGNVGSILQELITFNLIGNKLYQFKKGWSSMVEKLIEHLQKESKKKGVKLELRKNCGVTMISDDGSGFELTIKAQSDTSTEEISAKHVVLAVPPKALEAILSSTKYWKMNNNTIKNICGSVEGIHCTKINLYFDDDWWNQDDNILMYGPNVTSLPCGFVYPFYAKCKASGCNGCDECNDVPCAAALTIYCDVNNAQFWRSLQRLGHMFQSELQDQYEELLPASEPVVTEAIKQLSKVFNMKDIPYPILTSYRSWDGKEEYKANAENAQAGEHAYAVHLWGIGVDDYDVMKKVAKPIKEKNLYICNEAWSGYQGWVEGSLMSTQNAVNELLGLNQDD